MQRIGYRGGALSASEEAEHILGKLISYNTANVVEGGVYRGNGERAAAEYCAELLREIDVECRLVHSPGHPERASLIAHIRADAPQMGPFSLQGIWTQCRHAPRSGRRRALFTPR